MLNVGKSYPESGHKRIREFGSDGALTQEVVIDDPPHCRVTRIADTNLPFGGSWVYEINPLSDGTRLRITENGEIYNPIFRFVFWVFLGYSGPSSSTLRISARNSGRLRRSIPER